MSGVAAPAPGVELLLESLLADPEQPVQLRDLGLVGPVVAILRAPLTV